MFKKQILTFFVLLLVSFYARASHFVGGELIYDCLGNDSVRITMKVYRDCAPGNGPFDNPAIIWVYDTAGNHLDTFNIPLPPVTPVANSITFPCTKLNPNICVEAAIYQATFYLPPRPGGYNMVFQRCCRNSTITNITGGGMSYVETIHDTSIVSCNSTPRFTQFPPIYLCTGYPISFDHSATDPDGDSLVYELCDPLDQLGGGGTIYPPPYTSVPWVAPYNGTSPMSSNPAMNIDPQTGLLTGTPNQTGQWLIGVCVREYRNGIFLGSHQRQFQFNVLPCQPSVDLTLKDTTSIPCGSPSGGSISLSATGGAGSYTFNWNPNVSTDSIATNLSAGNYAISVMDSAGCKDSLDVMLNASSSVTLTVNSTNPTCGASDGQSTVTPSGPIITIVWNTTPPQNTLTATGLSAGTYTATITDSSNCIQDVVVNITNGAGGPTIDVYATAVSCYGLNDGSATVVTTGGFGTLTYSWSSNPVQDSIIATGLISGNYSVQVIDSAGCVSDTTFSITEPTQLLINNLTKADAQCSNVCNGTITVTAQGGTGAYGYSWTNTTGASNNVMNVCAGNYCVQITDAMGCTTDTCVNITFLDTLLISSTTIDETCGNQNGSVTITVAGGSPNYTYSWNSLSASTNNVSNLSAGQYCAIVTDLNGCIDSLCATVNSSAGFTVNSGPVTHLICNQQCTGTAAVSVTGTGAYIYSWNTTPTQTTATATGLCAGNYEVVVDENGTCFDTLQVIVTEPPAINITTATIPPDTVCKGSAVQVSATASGGNIPYSFTWSNGQTTADFTQTINGPTSLWVIANDADNCDSDTQQVVIEVYPESLISLMFGDTSGCTPVCLKFVNSSTPVSNMQWNFGDGTTVSGTLPIHCFYETGTFDVSVSIFDTHNCKTDTTFPGLVEVYPFPVPDFTYNPEEISTFDPNITFTDLSLGGNPWQWDLGDSTRLSISDSIVNHSYEIPDGTTSYMVTLSVTNQFGCEADTTKEIKVKPDWNMYVPNTFSPNGDSHNELFKAWGYGIDELEMWIYDRWGNQICHITDPNDGWNGKVQNGRSREDAQMDVYIWVIVMQDITKTQHTLTGHVNLLR